MKCHFNIINISYFKICLISNKSMRDMYHYIWDATCNVLLDLLYILNFFCGSMNQVIGFSLKGLCYRKSILIMDIYECPVIFFCRTFLVTHMFIKSESLLIRHVHFTPQRGVSDLCQLIPTTRSSLSLIKNRFFSYILYPNYSFSFI